MIRCSPHLRTIRRENQQDISGLLLFGNPHDVESFLVPEVLFGTPGGSAISNPWLVFLFQPTNSLRSTGRQAQGSSLQVSWGREALQRPSGLALLCQVAEGSDGRVGLPLRGLLMLRGLMSTGPPGEAMREDLHSSFGCFRKNGPECCQFNL